MPDNPNIIDIPLKKSFARNLSGLEINGESTLKKYIKEINFDDIKIMDLLKDNITSKDSRFLSNPDSQDPEYLIEEIFNKIRKNYINLFCYKLSILLYSLILIK